MHLRLISLLIIIIYFFCNSIIAQDRRHLDLNDFTTNKDYLDMKVSALIKGDADQLKEIVIGMGGKFKYNIGDISSIILSIYIK